MLAGLHRAHQGTTGMSLWGQDLVWWPGFSGDVVLVQEGCSSCIQSAPSQPATPPIKPLIPDYPFQLISADYFVYAGHSYLVVVDRYSGWPVVKACKGGTSGELVTTLREYFCLYGTLEEIATDGASVFVSAEMKRFLEVWAVRHRVSLAYNPHANLRAESAVKMVKCMIRENTAGKGSLDTDKMAMALLNYRNTPDRDTGLPSAQVLFSRKLRDAVPCDPRGLRLHPGWTLTWEVRELALAKSHEVCGTQLTEHTKELMPLKVGDCVEVKKQTGPHSNK